MTEQFEHGGVESTSNEAELVQRHMGKRKEPERDAESVELLTQLYGPPNEDGAFVGAAKAGEP